MNDAMAHPHAFDQSIMPMQIGERRYELAADRDYWNFTSAFGGWVSAAAVAAVECDPSYRGQLLSKDIRFMAPITAERLTLVVEHLVERRTTDFWRVSIIDAEDGAQLLATAEIATGAKRENGLDYAAAPPQHAAIEDGVRLEASAMTPRWFTQFEQILTYGAPFQINDHPKSVVFIRHADRRLLDAKALVSMADTPMPRVFFISEQPLMASTLTLSTHIYATETEIREAGGQFVILEANSAVIRHSTLNQEVRLFRQDGLLLATSYQIALFR